MHCYAAIARPLQRAATSCVYQHDGSLKRVLKSSDHCGRSQVSVEQLGNGFRCQLSIKQFSLPTAKSLKETRWFATNEEGAQNYDLELGFMRKTFIALVCCN